MRRSTPALALVLACAPVGPLAPIVPVAVEPTVTRAPEVAPTLDAVQPSPPLICPESHVGTRLSVGPDLRSTRVAAWDGVPGLRSPGVHANLPGVVTGLLWSVAYAAGADDCRDVPPSIPVGYRFTHERGPGYAPYFPSRGEGDNFLRDWQVPLPDGGIARYDAAMFGPRTGAHCLRACAHLATLEVNGGRGGRGLHFVATAVTVVDDLAPLVIPNVLADLRARFAASCQAEEPALQRLYDDARGQYPQISAGPRVDGTIRVEPTWIVDAAALEVLVWREGQVVGERRTRTETVPPANCVYPQPCAYRDAGTFDLFETLKIRSEVAARYRVDRNGLLVEETLYAPRVQTSAGDERRRR